METDGGADDSDDDTKAQEDDDSVSLQSTIIFGPHFFISTGAVSALVYPTFNDYFATLLRKQ
jgi:hypothetical protein